MYSKCQCCGTEDNNTNATSAAKHLNGHICTKVGAALLLVNNLLYMWQISHLRKVRASQIFTS